MGDAALLDGSARLMLADNVLPLDPQQAVLQAMLDGWVRQQQARFLKEQTIADRVRMVKRLVAFSNLYPWQWTAGDLEAFAADLRGGARPVLAGRNSARAALAAELPAVVLADLTGINISTAVAWSRQVKRDWTDLVATRASK